MFRAEFRITDAPRRAGLFLRVNTDPRRDIRGPLTDIVAFGIFLAGRGRIELRRAELIRIS
jgi:hypothetical protein